MIDKARTNRDYDQLVLVAEPRFLGRLRGKLTRQSQGTVVRMIEKELTKMTPPELQRRLSRLIAA